MDATFVIDSYTVSTTAGTGGTVSAGVSVNHGATTDITVTPDANYSIDTVTGCAGTLAGNTYTTGVVIAACTVDATFANLAPVADAGTKQVTEVLSGVTLDGSASSDPEAAGLTYSWSVVSIPAASAGITLIGDTAVNPTFTPDVTGEYTLGLVVNDGLSDSALSTVIVTALTSGSEYNSVDNSLDTFPLTIPDIDLAGISSTITVAGGPASIDYVRVYLDISHTWVGDVTVELTSPTGTTITLTWRNGGSGDGYRDTVFDDIYGSEPIGMGVAPFDGIYNPEGLLSGFDTEAADGEWTLIVIDAAGGDTGTLNSWKIVFPDIPAVAKPGDDQYVVVGDLVQLDAVASSGYSALNWQLTTPAGSGAVLSDAALVNPTFTADVGGLYVAELTASNGTDNSTAVVNIYVGNISADTPVVIPDNDLVGITSSIVVGDTLTVSGVVVKLTITHTWSADLGIYLISPTGTMVLLSSNNGSDTDDAYTGTIFGDAGVVDIDFAGYPFTDLLHRPEEPLSTFDGEDSNGTWQLLVFDGFGGDTGNLESWQLTIW